MTSFKLWAQAHQEAAVILVAALFVLAMMGLVGIIMAVLPL